MRGKGVLPGAAYSNFWNVVLVVVLYLYDYVSPLIYCIYFLCWCFRYLFNEWCGWIQQPSCLTCEDKYLFLGYMWNRSISKKLSSQEIQNQREVLHQSWFSTNDAKSASPSQRGWNWCHVWFRWQRQRWKN